VMVIRGELDILGELLGERDSIEISDAQNISFTPKRGAKLLVIEVPL
jgi:hypothetical protein